MQLRRRSFLPPGDWRYQIWYRNAAAFCTRATFDFTNAGSVQWQS